MPTNAYKLAALQRNKPMDLKRGPATRKKKSTKKVGKKKQGYAAREDESLGMRRGKESTKKQSMKDRRDESYGAWGKRYKGGKVNKRGPANKSKAGKPYKYMTATEKKGHRKVKK